MGGFFSLKKAFDGGTDFFGQIYGGFTKIHRFTNVFSSNLNSVNLKIFPGYGGRHT